MCVPLGHGIRRSRSSYSYNASESENRYYLYQVKTIKEDGTTVETSQIKCGTRKPEAISEAKRAAREAWSKGAVSEWTLTLVDHSSKKIVETGGYDKDRRVIYL